MAPMSIPLALLLGSLVSSGSPEPEVVVRQQLDALVEARWQTLQLTPEALADDATFFRRVWLDLAGRVPPVEKARAFLDDRAPDKRARLVDSLLAGEEFAEHWARGWTQTLTGRRPVRQDTHDGRLLVAYLKEALASDRSYRQIAVELLTAEGVSDKNGAVHFTLRYQARPIELTGALSKHFLGVTLQCAQCHDHPFADWKQADFWGVAGFFGRLRQFESAEEEGVEPVRAILETGKGELLQTDMTAPKDDQGNYPKKKILPRLPGGQPLTLVGNRRRALAAWVTADDNPYFARHLVNRTWGQLFGKPLVGSLDRPTLDSDGRHPQLLELLARDFVAGGYQLKRLLRIVLLSRPYQLSAGGSELASGGEAAAELKLKKVRNLACFPVRSLSVDQLYQSLVQVSGHTGTETESPAEMPEDDGSPDTPFDVLTEHAGTLQRTLALMNGEYIQEAVVKGIERCLKQKGQKLGAAHVEHLFLATLSRRPAPDESAALLKLVRSHKAAGLEDVLWALFNSVEFTTNH